MDQPEFEQNKKDFVEVLSQRIQERVGDKIGQAMLEILASHDIFIAGTLQVDVPALIRKAAIDKIDDYIKED